MTDEELKQITLAETKKLSDEEMLRWSALKGLDDLFYFDRNILGYREMTEHTHRPLTDFICDPKSDKKLILLPRGTFKSSCVTIGYSLWNIVKNPNIRILIGSENYTNACKFLGAIKGHISQSRIFRQLYGQLDYKKNSTRWTDEEIVVATRTNHALKEPTISCAGVETPKVGLHYDLIIVDDPVSENNIGTKEQLEKTINWVKLMFSILEPHGTMIVIGTRWHFADLYSWIIREQPDEFDIMIKKAIMDGGELYFPERLTIDFLNRQKRIQGSYIFSAQYQNEVIPAEDAKFKMEWMKNYDEKYFKSRTLKYFTTIDLATPPEADSGKLDYSVILTCAIDQDKNIYIVDIKRGQWHEFETVENLFSTYNEFRPSVVGVEATAFQRIYKSYIDDEMRKRGVHMYLKELKGANLKTKAMRIIALQPYFENGTIWLKEDLTNKEQLIYELISFPKAEYDDVIDALAYQLEIIFPPKPGIDREERREKLKYLQTPIGKWY